jgi:hypothetical protein
MIRDPPVRSTRSVLRVSQLGRYGSPDAASAAHPREVDSGGSWVFPMSTRWENVVSLAREVDAAFARGQVPDSTIVARLARAVLDFQKELSGATAAPNSRPPPSRPPGF